MRAEAKHLIFITLGLAFLLQVSSCGNNKKDPYIEVKLDLSLVDKDGTNVTTIAKDQPSQVFIAVNKNYGNQNTGFDIAVLSASCVNLSSTSLNLSNVAGSQYSHSDPLVLSALESCQAGENALIVFEVKDPSIPDQKVTSLINLKIEDSTEVPSIKVTDFYLDSAKRSTLYPSQEFTFSFRVSNEGKLNVRELQVTVEPVGPLETLDMKIVAQNQKITAGEASVLTYEGALKIMPYLGEANAVAFIVRWQANKTFSGEETITIPIASPVLLTEFEAQSVIKNIPANLMDIPEQDPDSLELVPPPTQKYEWVEVGFTLKNETDFSFGPGEIKITKLSRGEIEGYYDRVLFGKIPASYTYKIPSGSLRIKPIGNAKIISFKLEIQTKKGFHETVDVVLRKAEGNLWQVQ